MCNIELINKICLYYTNEKVEFRTDMKYKKKKKKQNHTHGYIVLA